MHISPTSRDSIPIQEVFILTWTTEPVAFMSIWVSTCVRCMNMCWTVYHHIFVLTDWVSHCNKINGWLRQKSIFFLKNKWEETSLMACTVSLSPHPWGIISPNPYPLAHSLSLSLAFSRGSTLADYYCGSISFYFHPSLCSIPQGAHTENNPFSHKQRRE